MRCARDRCPLPGSKADRAEGTVGCPLLPQIGPNLWRAAGMTRTIAKPTSYTRARTKCWMPSGKSIQGCLVCSQIDKVGSGKSGSANAPNGNAIMDGSEIKMPVDRTSASGTKMKADRPVYSFNIPRIDFFWTFDLNPRFREVYARVHDRAGASLARLAMAHGHDCRFSANSHT